MHRSSSAIAAVVFCVGVGCTPSTFTPRDLSVATATEPDAVQITLGGAAPTQGCNLQPHTLIVDGEHVSGEVVPVGAGPYPFAPGRCEVAVTVPVSLDGGDMQIAAAEDEWTALVPDAHVDRRPRVDANVLQRGARYEVRHALPDEIEDLQVTLYGNIDDPDETFLSVVTERTATGASFVVPDEATTYNRLTLEANGSFSLRCEDIDCTDVIWRRFAGSDVNVID